MQVLLSLQVQQAGSACTGGTQESIRLIVAAAILLDQTSGLIIETQRQAANDPADHAIELLGRGC